MKTQRGHLFGIFVMGLQLECLLYGGVAHADSLDNWSTQIVATNVSGGFRDVAFGNGRYVAVGDSPCTPDYGIVATSDDGVLWTVRRNGCTEYPASISELLAITYAAGQFVAVGYLGSIYNSPDGITWVQRAQAPFYNFTGVAYGNGKFVAVGDGQLISGGTTKSNIYTSTDGATWAAQTPAIFDSLTSIAFNGTTFVAIGSTNAYRSSPILPWTPSTIGYSHSGRITWCNGLFVIPAGIGTNLVSPNGATWTIQTNDSPIAFTKILYQHGIYLGIGATNAFLTSTNGTNWMERHFPSAWNDFYVSGITLGGSQAVAVAFSRFGLTSYSIALTSEPLVALEANSSPGQLTISGVSGASYRVESLDSLTGNSWLVKAAFSLPGSPYLWTDTSGLASSRFYRAVLLP